MSSGPSSSRSQTLAVVTCPDQNWTCPPMGAWKKAFHGCQNPSAKEDQQESQLYQESHTEPLGEGFTQKRGCHTPKTNENSFRTWSKKRNFPRLFLAGMCLNRCPKKSRDSNPCAGSEAPTTQQAHLNFKLLHALWSTWRNQISFKLKQTKHLLPAAPHTHMQTLNSLFSQQMK